MNEAEKKTVPSGLSTRRDFLTATAGAAAAGATAVVGVEIAGAAITAIGRGAIVKARASSRS